MAALRSDSLERIVPDQLDESGATGRETLELHVERYAWAARFLRPGRLLDLACGVGYGTRLLADRASVAVHALGVDRSGDAVRYAQRRYGSGGARFEVGDAMTFDDPEGFDSIVSLETVEHLKEPEAFLARMVRLLRPGGVLVASVPSTPSVDLNPHHCHDFTEASFRRMVAPHGLKELDCLRQGQPVRLAAILTRSESRLSDLRPKLWRYYLTHPRAVLRRIGATLRYGFSNRYLTIAWEKPAV